MSYKGQPFEYARWWKQRCLFIILGFLGTPKTYLDIGCGDSYFIKLMKGLIGDCYASGVDLTASQGVLCHDLTTPLDMGGKFEMVVSLEVGEHLPKESADTYCDTLVRHTDKWLVFSAAQPNQSGSEHINCQSKEYWLGKLQTRGLKLNSLTKDIALAWSKFVPEECRWAYDNLMILEKE